MKVPPVWTALTTTDNTAWSFARVTTFALIAATIFWITWIVVYTLKIPDNLPGLSAVLLSLYGVNRAAEAYESRPTPPPNPPSVSTQNVEVHP